MDFRYGWIQKNEVMRTLFLCKSALFSCVWDPLCIQAYFMVEGWLQQPQILCTLNSKARGKQGHP